SQSWFTPASEHFENKPKGTLVMTHQEKALHIDIPVKLKDVKTVYLKFSQMSAFGSLRSSEQTNQEHEGVRDREKQWPTTNSTSNMRTYKAVQVTEPNKFQLVELPIREPEHGQVRVRVEACGVCHSDSGTVEAVFPINWPRVPGHEVVGRIDTLGSGVQGWAVDQRVGVGFLGGSCGYCEFCRNGDLVNCRNQGYTGIHSDGGYAEMMIAKASGLVSIPDDLASAGAAPLLCAGLTTFNALRNSPAKAGDLVAVLGIGGLGHLGVQYARHMGFEVAAIARGPGTAELAKKLGAHHYIDSAATDPAAALQALGGAKVILITASGGKTVAATFKGLRPGGVSIDVGAGPDPIEITSEDLIFG